MKPENKVDWSTFDPELAVRNSAYGAIMGLLLGPRVGIPNEYSPLIGGVVAAAVDRGIFWLKGRFRKRSQK